MPHAVGVTEGLPSPVAPCREPSPASSPASPMARKCLSAHRARRLSAHPAGRLPDFAPGRVPCASSSGWFSDSSCSRAVVPSVRCWSCRNLRRRGRHPLPIPPGQWSPRQGANWVCPTVREGSTPGRVSIARASSGGPITRTASICHGPLPNRRRRVLPYPAMSSALPTSSCSVRGRACTACTPASTPATVVSCTAPNPGRPCVKRPSTSLTGVVISSRRGVWSGPDPGLFRRHGKRASTPCVEALSFAARLYPVGRKKSPAGVCCGIRRGNR